MASSNSSSDITLSQFGPSCHLCVTNIECGNEFMSLFVLVNNSRAQKLYLLLFLCLQHIMSVWACLAAVRFAGGWQHVSGYLWTSSLLLQSRKDGQLSTR